MHELFKKIKFIKAIKFILIVLIATALVIFLIRPNKTVAAGEHTVTVKKVSTVSIYVSGPGVFLESSDNNVDVYKVDTNTDVTFYAVNESRIFSSWNITDPDNSNAIVSQSTDSITTITDLNRNLEVSVSRKDATANDYGKYILDRYVIQDEDDLIAVQDIVAGNGDNSDFAEFYDDVTLYDTLDEKNALAEKFRTGYFVILHNFTVFNSNFVGIGTKTYPFQGVMCGLNNGVNSSIFLTITAQEKNGEQAYGLFKYLGPSAVVRNLNIVSTIGISASTTNSTGQIYAGGLTGHLNKSLLVNVNVESKIGINVNYSDLYVGGIAGYIATGSGFDSVGDVKYIGNSTNWTLQSSANGDKIYAGLVAGYASNTYIRSITVDVTNSVVDLKNDNTTYSNASQVAVGNIFGYYNNTEVTSFDDINIVGSGGQILRTVANGGDSYVGGLVGYVNASSKLYIGKIKFNVVGSKNQYLSTSLNSLSRANLYSGGLFGYINGNNCEATSNFKNRLNILNVDGEEIKVFDYLFEGIYEIKSIQNGTPTATSHGKAISGGLVGKGYININGNSDTDRSSLVFASPNSSLTISSIQSKLSNKTTLDDEEHACAGLIYGSVGSTALNINDVDVYTNNTIIQTVREIGAKAMGNLHTGGFVGYVVGSSLQNISLYFNDSDISAQSLSFEKESLVDAVDRNSAFCGGLVGEATNNSTINNILFAGYDTRTGEVVGTTTKMESIQNTYPPGGTNYCGENYIGGIVGRIQYTAVTNCKYYGSNSEKDYIKMSGHESPDSAFCGGIVGLIMTATNTTQSRVSDCVVENANIVGAATVVRHYNNPDIYIGGIIGAAYLHDTNVDLNVSNCKVYETDVYALGNEDIAVYAGGIIGGATWQRSCTITNCYVSGGSVIANQTCNSTVSGLESAAGGIIGSKGANTAITVSYCAVMDVEVSASSNNSGVTPYAAGVGSFVESGNFTIINCYSNAIVSATGTNRKSYPIVVAGTVSSNANAAYYISKNISTISTTINRIIGVSSGPFTVNTETNIYGTINTAHRNGNKLYIETNSPYFTTNWNPSTNVTVTSINNSAYHSTLANVWVNVKNGGDTVKPTDYDTIRDANDAGWFIFDQVILRNNSSDFDLSSNLENIDTTYTDGIHNYKHYYDNETDKHFIQNINNSADIITDNYQEKEVINDVKSYTLKVYDDMLKLQINFQLTEIDASYNIVFLNSSKTKIDNAFAMNTYGKVELIKLDDINYMMVYTPNKDIEQDTIFYIEIQIGTTGYKADVLFEFNLISNKIVIVDVTYADYTPPLNYYLSNEVLGSNDEPFKLYTGSVTKFIPVVKKSNDLDKSKIYILEEYIENYSYSLSTANVGSIYSSGELVADSTAGSIGVLTLTDKYYKDENGDAYSISAYIQIVPQYPVTYNITGADATGLTYATMETDFYFEQIIRSNYSGDPSIFTITIGNNVNLNLTNPNSYPKDNAEDNKYVLVYEIYQDNTVSETPITKWDSDAHGYIVYVGNGYLDVNGNNISMNISVEYTLSYTITLDLQCETFNADYEGGLIKSYKIISGVKYKDFFNTIDNTDTVKNELNEWANNAAIFGYVFKGFYLVDSANSLDTYGISLDDLLESETTISASTTFYARWTFLIELVEAPGTYIKSSFPATFMENHYEEDSFNRTIQIPINSNKGYIFTIEKDDNFLGEASVRAYSVKKNNGEKQITEIAIEKYHDNMYLYYIPPEYIDGYLIIVTSVSNSEIIVGENTASVTEEILPEDGVSTFKYIINHKNIPNDDPALSELSFIYDSGKDIDNDGNTLDDKGYNLTLTKNFKLRFYLEKYSEGNIIKIPRALAAGTTVEVFYSVYYNEDVTNTTYIVGVYKAVGGETEISLDSFKLLDLKTKAFPEQTFNQFLGSNQHVSELFYFVITPPNGIYENVDGEVINYIIEGGYYDENRDEYISGIRSTHDLANKNDLDNTFIQGLLIESSLETKTYSVTPSRVTKIEKNGTNYTFTDKKTFEVYNLELINTSITNNYIRLFDDATQSIIESSELKFGINKLKLTLGYGVGEVRIYGFNGTDWIIVGEINVNTAVYSEYEISFDSYKYTKFRIDNISTNEIRLNKIDLVSRSNKMTYEGNISSLIHKTGSTYAVYSPIVGDDRHNGKTFMLAVQLNNASGIVDDIRGSVYITVNDTKYYCTNDQIGTNNYGKTVAYINLSKIINTLNTDKIDFTLTIPTGYTVHEVQLLEVENIYKPALGEIRK